MTSARSTHSKRFEGRMEFRLAPVDEATREEHLDTLADWLRFDPAFRVRPEKSPPNAGEMGSITDALVVAVGSGGAITALASSLHSWLTAPKRSKVAISVRTKGGGEIVVDADRVTVE